jgi:hypothetical protein
VTTSSAANCVFLGIATLYPIMTGCVSLHDCILGTYPTPG